VIAALAEATAVLRLGEAAHGFVAGILASGIRAVSVSPGPFVPEVMTAAPARPDTSGRMSAGPQSSGPYPVSPSGVSRDRTASTAADQPITADRRDGV